MLTIEDVEGVAESELKTELSEWGEGIAHNYDDLDVIENQEFGLAVLFAYPGRVAALAIGPAAYLVFLIVFRFGKDRLARKTDRASRGAYRTLARSVKVATGAPHPAEPAELLDAFKRYLGVACEAPAVSMTYRDVAPRLEAMGATEATLDAVRKVFEVCEAGRYGGTTEGAESPSTRILAVAKEIEGLRR